MKDSVSIEHIVSPEDMRRLEYARSKLHEAQKALDAAEREYGDASRAVHHPTCRYFNGLDMTCTCGADP
jgi:hypothetical protein